MTNRTFRPHEPDRIFLLPPALRERLPAGHLAYFILDVVATLDLDEVLASYGGPARGALEI